MVGGVYIPKAAIVNDERVRLEENRMRHAQGAHRGRGRKKKQIPRFARDDKERCSRHAGPEVEDH